MGLDAVELVLEVEESFGVKIPDDRASEIRTVGDLYELILATRPIRDTAGHCLSGATFRMIRRVATLKESATVSRLRPRDAVNSIMPPTGRRRFWNQLQNDLSLRLPRLVRPKWLVTASAIVTLSLTASAGYFGLAIGNGSVAFPFAVATAIIVTAVLMLMTIPFAVYPPREFATFRGLTGAVLAFNYASLSERFQTSDRESVWNALCFIIAEQLGVEREDLTPSTRFVDLGM